MPTMIVVRLHPEKPVTGQDFLAFLNGLTLNAYDLSTGSPGTGSLIGSASYVAPPVPAKPWLPDPTTRIVQHYALLAPPALPYAEAVATALIVETAPPAAEYQTADLRIEILRGGVTVTEKNLFYDVKVINGAIPAPTLYQGLPENNVALYLGLPRPLSAGLTSLDMPADGTPPNFAALKTAIQAVLASDNGPIPALTAITAEQAKHIAAEIIWGEQEPLPFPPNEAVPSGWDKFGTLYSLELQDESDDGKKRKQNRMQFEGDLNSFYAVRNAKVTKLARYVLALSCAIKCQEMSSACKSALLQFPVQAGVNNPQATQSHAELVLVDGTGGAGALVPAFTVPAEYFYALGVQLPTSMGAEQRFLLATRDNQERLLPLLTNALDSGVINLPAVNPAQAVRRLTALQPASASMTTCLLNAAVLPLVNVWLAFPSNATWRSYRAGDDDLLFWTPQLAGLPLPYLQLDLCALTENFTPLITAILALPVNSVAALAALSTAQWHALFGTPPNVALLPPYTAPGTPEARVEAFIRRLQTFFGSSFTAPGLPSVNSTRPLLAWPTVDLISQFVSQYGALTFGAGPLNQAQVLAAAQAVLPGDAAAQAWLRQRIQVLNDLCLLAAVVSNVTTPSLAFSIAEALYARGFTSLADVAALTLDDFTAALRGTVAYAQASAIYARAGAGSQQPPATPKPFSPVNPGSLVNCVPPCHLSPLGTVEYLHELLKLAEASNCRVEFPPGYPGGGLTLGQILGSRTGDFGQLAVSRANAETALPLIDIVNENLEHLVAILPGAPQGVVHDTAENSLHGYPLCGASGASADSACYPAQQLLAAIPQYSAPAVPVADASAYQKLSQDFSAPSLPYAQTLDVTRSYLDNLGSCRFEVMRNFQKEITEFALEPSLAAPIFQSHLWRYPVRLNMALEYLGIGPEEYEQLYSKDLVDVPTPDHLGVYTVYGFLYDPSAPAAWLATVLQVPEFLRRTGLSYCELVQLQKSACFPFSVVSRSDPQHNPQRDPTTPPTPTTDDEHVLPDCEPCCLSHYHIRFPATVDARDMLRMLAVFLRLWRKLQAVCGARYSFSQLCDICSVLHLFNGTSINPDFIRQLAAFQLLRDQFHLPLSAVGLNLGSHGAERTPILALWVGASASHWSWAVTQLLNHVQHYALAQHGCQSRPPHFIKLLQSNLTPLSKLAGFDPSSSTDNWHAKPASTLRFAEVLSKIYASEFGVGEILYLFSADAHLDGDDPFPLQDENEANDDPLSLPEDDTHDLWQLRSKLLAVEVSQAEQQAWTWHEIVAVLGRRFGYTVSPGSHDYLLSLGQHFFPSVLTRSGVLVSQLQQRYQVDLTPATEAMWNLPLDGPFQYDDSTKKLWMQIPLRDAAVLDKLLHLRALNATEQLAVQDLYHLPRLDLVHFACFFPDLAAAERHLIEEADEDLRWQWFRQQFALHYKRCQIIAAHLASHVAAASGTSWQAALPTAWLVLQNLLADENQALTPWEADSGSMPGVTWKQAPNGSAFAALLGLTGTGLLGQYLHANNTLAWRETRGPMSAFDALKNAQNAPVPTILPAMDLQLSAAQLRFVEARNGMALADQDGRPLGGAEGFVVKWSGVLLVEQAGRYHFSASAMSMQARWRVTLARGQKTALILEHEWQENSIVVEPDLSLKRGAYTIEVEFVQPPPEFPGVDDVFAQQTGFQIEYAGPDTADAMQTLPLSRLYRIQQEETLDLGLRLNQASQAKSLLKMTYTSSLRDIRRSYQRAFKAMLLVQRLQLSGQPLANFQQSELGYLLAHSDQFAGVSYYRDSGTFARHEADFNFNFLPLKDMYYPPLAGQDQRAAPSAQRQQALFDWWERLFDYGRMRAHRARTLERPVWLLFEEAASLQPDNPAQLVRHLLVDLRHAELVLHYVDAQANAIYAVLAHDLEDERWAVRVWHADQWVLRLLRHFTPRDIRLAKPALWASSDPAALVAPETVSGNANLTQFVYDAYLANSEPRRYQDVQALNDGLRQRARCALLAYLCGMNRVLLPAGAGYAESPKDLSVLLLQDVEVGLCERASRIENAISIVQTFIQRARLGLEPGFSISAEFIQLWKNVFANYAIWEKCKARTLYKENWIEWAELKEARKIEAFQFLEAELRRSSLTIAVPGGLEYWPASLPPAHPALKLLQQRQPSSLQLLNPPRQGLGVLGTEERDARPSWLAPDVGLKGRSNPNDPKNPTTPGNLTHVDEHNRSTALAGHEVFEKTDKLPFWIAAAIRLGSKFVRLAAAGVAPAASNFRASDFHPEPGCCSECGCTHEALADEYYFWLLPAQIYEAPEQEANYDPTQQIATDWHEADALPTLLDWQAANAVQLAWCRVHNGEFKQQRRSQQVLKVSSSLPDLVFVGRLGDSLTFAVTGGVARTGYHGSDAPGFRYDLATDRALALPLLVDADPLPSFPAHLPAYPYFVYVEPGARLFPNSLFSPATAVAALLRCHCHFEPALKWYQLLVNPLQHHNAWVDCGHTGIPNDPHTPPQIGEVKPGHAPTIVLDEKPKRKSKIAKSEDSGKENSPASTVALASAAAAVNLAASVAVSTVERPTPTLPELSDLPSIEIPPRPGRISIDMCCDSTNISAETARQRAIVLHYLQTLLDWGHALLKHNSREAVQQARLIFDTAANILGPCPRTISNHQSADQKQTVAHFKAENPPLNPRLLDLYAQVKDGEALIHRCLSEARLPNSQQNCRTPYWGQTPCAPVTTACDPCDAKSAACCDEGCLPDSPYRFVYLLQKAQEAASQVRELGNALVSAFERGDAEYLASMRVRHETQLADMTIQVRQNQWRDAEWQVQALGKSKLVSQTNRLYYKHLIDLGLNLGELNYQSNTMAAIALRTSAIPIEAVGEGLRLIPDMFVGFPVSMTWLPLGSKLGEMFQTIARIINESAEIASINASLDLTQAGWQRRLEDWVHQVEVLDIEIEQMELQILGAERRRDQALQELNIQQTQLEQAREVQNFLRDKFTSHELYLFLQKETAALYWKMYELARQLALSAQRAFNFELGYLQRRFLGNDEWDTLHEGLLAGERLQLALQRMESEYINSNRREYELTKNISLACHFPLQFLQLKMTGSCEIEVPEWMFDMDYAGQYMRRIKNVSLTIPCVTGPYTGVHCRLTLLRSQTRINPLLPCPQATCCNEQPRQACGCQHQSHEHYAAACGDTRFVHDYGSKEAIATSSGRNDAGLFELNFRDERHLPFEYAGAVSCWKLDMPAENNYFDMDSLSDVVMQLNYTAREGGSALRAAALASMRQRLPGDGWIMLDLRRDYPDTWELFQRSAQGGERTMDMKMTRNLFPFLPNDPNLCITQLAFMFELEEDCCVKTCQEIEACPCPSEDVQDSFLLEITLDHADDDTQLGNEIELNCVMDSAWPQLYSGSTKLRIPINDACQEAHTLTLTLEDEKRKLLRGFMLCHYEIIS